MVTRLARVLSIFVLALCACSDDEGSPVAPDPTPSTDRYVNAATGDDAANGTSGSPWATISYAVATAAEGITIRVAPGVYDATLGETFPIQLKPGQKLIGDVANKGISGEPTQIHGEGAFIHDTLTGTAIVGAEGARVAGFAIVSQTNANFYSCIAVVDSVVMEIDNNTFLNQTYTGVGSSGGAAPDIHDNLFQNRTYALLLDESAAVHVHDNRMEAGAFGVRYFAAVGVIIEDNTFLTTNFGVQTGSGTGIIRNNRFESASYTNGAILCQGASPVIRGNSFTGGPAIKITGNGTPNAGTVADPGLNNFTGLTGVIVQHDGTALATLVGNTWTTYPPVIGTDIVITSTGSVVWE